MSKRDYESRDNNQNRTADTSGSFLLGAIIGGIAGAAATLLLTTKTGKEVRDSITGQAGRVIEKTAPFLDNVKSRTSSLPLIQHSAELLNKATGNNEEIENETEISYIPIKGSRESSNDKETAGTKMDSEAIKKKLEEARRAFEEEESKVKF
ncbi:YtxH domain-containing protein [Neobacillus dielmonensis]|uniref:YtxH domain-containing protein n=1 Tax=Neobacillus dielmonensis TaxID=1347369 RepID=UPI0005AB7988|nr:YtxH domain-containing protein [Neobacillus dielmonensis]